jgi:small-conductance mechanosensitive channel
VTIGYDVPWRAVYEALIRAALATPDVLAVPKPFVFQTSLDDSYVSYEINAYTREPVKMAVTYSNLHQNIQDSFNEAGIEILSPSFSAVRDGNTVTIPPEHRPKDYRPPSFRVEVDGGK